MTLHSGAVGTGKTSCCMYPFTEQILAYRAADPEKRIGGLVLEVKGDFCHRVREILARHGRAEDYVEIGLDSGYRYNPLHNDLDAYALAYNIASFSITSSAGVRNRSGSRPTRTWSSSSSFCTRLHTAMSRFSMFMSAPSTMPRSKEKSLKPNAGSSKPISSCCPRKNI